MDVGTAVGIASLGIQVCQGLLEYYSKWKDFDEDIRTTHRAIARLDAIFSELNKALIDIDQNRKQHIVNALIACNDNVAKLEKKAKKLQTHEEPKGFREKLATQRQKVIYPFRQSTLIKLREIAADTQDQLSLALQVLQINIGIESEKTLKDITNQFQTIKLGMDGVSQQTGQTLAFARRQDERLKLEILDWLAKPDYAAQQATHIRDHMAGSGSWLLDAPEFQHWSQDVGDFLFLYGAPGVGKTMLSSIVIEHLQTESEQSGEGLCYFYCDFNRRNEQQLNKILLCLARQLTEPLVDLPACITELYSKHRPKQTTPNTDEASQTLFSVAKTYSKLYIIVDALDECQEAFNTQKELMTRLVEMKNANVLATSRPLPDIMSSIAAKTKLEIRADDGEIGRYVDENIKRLPSFVLRSSDIQHLIRSSIVKTVRGVYLLAKLLIDSLIGSKSLKHLRGILKSFDTENDIYAAAYSKTLNRINSQSQGNTQLAFEALTWIVFAHRPIDTHELLHALAIETGELEFDEENIPDLDQVITSCLGLVIVELDTQVIRLSHQTIQEYFKGSGAIWLEDGHLKILHSCLSYLSMESFKIGICNDEEQLKDRFTMFPFYAYASTNWGCHTYELEDLSAVDRFLGLNEHVQAAIQALFFYWTGPRSILPFRVSGYTGLHLAAFFHSHRLALYTIQTQDIDARGSHGWTALGYAASKGYSELVCLLLNNGAKIHSYDRSDPDPLLAAAELGQVEVVEILLDKKAEINFQGAGGQSVLSVAVCNLHENIVVLLIDRGARLDLKNSDGNTPLHIAAMKDSPNMAAILITNGARIESQNNSGQTPLSLAAYYGSVKVAALLIDFGAQVDIPNSKEDAPRTISLDEIEGMLATLLSEAEAQPNAADISDDRERSTTDKDEKEGIVRVLLGSEMDLIHKIERGMSILQIAILRGHLKVVRYLLKFEATNMSSLVASSLLMNGNEESSIQANSADSVDSTRNLSTTGNRGLLSFIDQTGKTSLHFAVLSGHVKILEYLLSKGMNIDAQDNFGRTVLHFASMSTSAPMLSKVLEFNNSVNIHYKTLWSPLHWACRNGNFDMVKLLVDTGFKCSSVSTADPLVSWTPLDVTVYHGNAHLITRQGILVKTHPWTTLAKSGLIAIDSRQLVSMYRANDLTLGTASNMMVCNGCEINIIGTWFHCQVCEDFDLCFMCKAEPGIERMHPDHGWDRH